MDKFYVRVMRYTINISSKCRLRLKLCPTAMIKAAKKMHFIDEKINIA